MPLITDFILSYTSGRTIDGRQFPDEWVPIMSERYSPKTYTANLNLEHITYINLGTIPAIKHSIVDVPNVGERQGLFCQLEPNASFLSFVKDKNRKYWLSIRINPKFPYKDGAGPYLEHVAITTDPASIGVQQLDFSSKSDGPIITDPVEVTEEMMKLVDYEFSKDDKESDFFKKFYLFFKDKLNFSSQENTQPAEDEEMNEEQFNKMIETIDTMGQTIVGSIETSFSKLNLKPGEKPNDKTSTKDDKGDSEGGEKKDFSIEDTLKDIQKRLPTDEQLTSLSAIDDMRKSIDELKGKAGKAIGEDAGDVTTSFSKKADEDSDELSNNY